MKAPAVTTIDFETEAIQARPQYPPKPVGVSIKLAGEKHSRYYAWGHPTKNNCTKEQGRQAVKDAYKTGELLFHHAKFDCDVADVHLGVRIPAWDKTHDTLYQLFLHDPYSISLSLKPAAERILGMKPAEREVLKDWILANVPEARRKPSEWGAYISRAPGDLVGKYADGDVLRTEKLHQKIYPTLVQRGMLPAYNRERQLMPILLENERQGVRIDLPRMERDYIKYLAALETVDRWLCKRLKQPSLDLNKKEDVAAALDASGVVTDWVLTKTGKKSVGKKNMTLEMFQDARVASAWQYRQMLSTCLHSFFEPWLEMARNSGGLIYTNWNQVRQSHGNDNLAGARTGRMSSNPSLMNVPKNWKKAESEGFVHPAFIKELPTLPIMRVYFLPDGKGQVWGRRDYNQQELRILAHFEDGSLMEGYNTNPRLDVHTLVQTGIKEIAGLDMHRDPVKIANFGEIYGMGLGEMAARMKIDIATAKRFKTAKRALMPDFGELEQGIKARGKAGLAIRTWGGREYFAEPGKYVEKYRRYMTFEYKLLNYLIQGSAADCTKESIIRYHNHPKRRGRFLITVHDENNISSDRKVFQQEMALLREVMQSVEFDVPMLSDGEYGANWGTLEKFKEPEYKLKTKAATQNV